MSFGVAFQLESETKEEALVVYVAGICGNPAFPEMPRQFRKCLSFPQLPRQLGK